MPLFQNSKCGDGNHDIDVLSPHAHPIQQGRCRWQALGTSIPNTNIPGSLLRDSNSLPTRDSRCRNFRRPTIMRRRQSYSEVFGEGASTDSGLGTRIRLAKQSCSIHEFLGFVYLTSSLDSVRFLIPNFNVF